MSLTKKVKWSAPGRSQRKMHPKTSKKAARRSLNSTAMTSQRLPGTTTPRKVATRNMNSKLLSKDAFCLNQNVNLYLLGIYMMLVERCTKMYISIPNFYLYKYNSHRPRRLFHISSAVPLMAGSSSSSSYPSSSSSYSSSSPSYISSSSSL